MEGLRPTGIPGGGLPRAQGNTRRGVRGLSVSLRVQRLAGGSPVFMAVFDLPWTLLFIGAIFVFHPWLGWLAARGAVC